MEENNNNFKFDTNYQKFHFEDNTKPGFTRNILLPFICGATGCAVVIGTCFGVPSIKEKILNTNSTPTSLQTSVSHETSGTVSQVSLSSYSDTAVYAANKILPSIVGIEITYNVTSTFSLFGSTSTSTATASGSGIIISEDGYILTNNHVVDSASNSSYYQLSEATSVKVKLFNNEKTYDAKIVGKDSTTDLAVIKIDAKDLVAAEFADSDAVKVGEFAMAVGNPLGLESSITCGVVSAVNRKVSDSDKNTYVCIQTDAAINSGNSGGALVNSEGKVIGINTLKLSGTSIEGMGFAIPINSTLNITKDLIEYNKVLRPYIGITGIELDEKTAKANKLVEGIYIKAIDNFSAAEKAELKVGDVIIEADGKTIKTMNELNEIKNTHKIGEELKLKINREKKKKEITLILGEQP